MKQHYNFKKPCKKCNKLFSPPTKNTILCDKCRIDSINLFHLKRLRISLSSFNQRNLINSDKDYVKKILEFSGYLDVQIKKLGEKDERK